MPKIIWAASMPGSPSPWTPSETTQRSCNPVTRASACPRAGAPISRSFPPLGCVYPPPPTPRASTAAGVLAAGLVVFVLLWFEPQTALINKRVDEATPAGIAAGAGARAEVLGSGEFRGLEHETTGRAILLDAPDGTQVLRLEDLDTLNGPDLRVYLSELPAGLDERAYGEANEPTGNGSSTSAG
jgi:hypothetical protein